MSRRMLRLMVCVACTVGLGASIPAAAGAVAIGIQDGSPAMFSNPHFIALHVTTARTLVPWDVMTRRADRHDLAVFRAWLRGAQRDHVSPLVSFAPDFTNPAANFVPNVSQYRKAVQKFLKAFPKVKLYTPWNEPDFPYRSLARHPTLAAAYFNTLAGLCGRRCKVLAGDVFLPVTGQARIDGSVATLRAWLRIYISGLHRRPAGWALHDYREIRGKNTAQLRTLMSLTKGPIYLDETGGILRRGHWQYKNQNSVAAAKDEKFLLSLPKRFHRIAAIYHYQWQADPKSGWDSALLAANGKPRPAYSVLLKFIRAQAKKKK